MNEHLQDLRAGGRPMTKLEKANKEIERLNHLLEDIKIHLESYDYDNMSLDAKVLARNVSLIINGTIKVIREEQVDNK